MAKRGRRYEFTGITVVEMGRRLRVMVNGNCSRCHGRGHTGFNRTTGKSIACKCLRTVSLPINRVIL